MTRCSVTALTMLTLAAAPPPAAIATDLPARFQAELDRQRRELDLPGVTAAYLLPDGVAHTFASGSADRERGLPATPETRMLSGSTGKTFVSALALATAQEGKLALDDPIERWLGKEPWFGRLPNARAITVRMLLNHTSGLADHVYTEAFSGALARLTPDQQLAPAELVGFLLDTKPLFAAGQGFNYSDTNYILAGMILERAGGTTFYQQIQRRFLYPLDLGLTAPSPGRIHPGLAQGYLATDSPLAVLGSTTLDRGVFRFDPGSEWTGGGLVTSPRDLVRWASALYGGRAIGARAVEEMVRLPKVASGEDGREGYGLGVYVNRGEHGPEYGHGGWFPGYRTSFAYYVDRGVAVAVQTNTDVPSTEAVHALRAALARVVLKRAEASSAPTSDR